MSNISLSMSRGANSTIISNRFIDEFMPDANGTYVKVYIYLLRLISDSSNISLSLIAERLDETEKDIRRALKYWEKTGIIRIEYDSEDQITGIDLSPEASERPERQAEIIQLRTEQVLDKVSTKVQPVEVSVSVPEVSPAAASVISFVPGKRPTYSLAQVNEMRKDSSISGLMKSIEQKLRQPVSPEHMQLILYLYEGIGFNIELIDYLYEYCVSLEKSAPAYIEKVALAWANDGISSAEVARERNAVRTASASAVMKAFGLTKCEAIQRTFIQKWTFEWGFSSELLTEACNRAVLAKNKADFRCADRILEDWKNKNVHSLSDLSRIDAEHAAAASAKPAVRSRSTTPNSFNSFAQRSYEADELEDMLLNKKQG